MFVAGNARELLQHALDHGWEGLIAKDAHSLYHTGKRTRDWRKLKIVHEQEFVVGGWTDSRTTGRPFGALLLGYYEDGGSEVCRPYRAAASIISSSSASSACSDRWRSAASPFTIAAADQRAAALDETLTRRAAEIHGVDRRRSAPPSDLSGHEGRCETGNCMTGKEEFGESEESGGVAKSRKAVQRVRGVQRVESRESEQSKTSGDRQVGRSPPIRPRPARRNRARARTRARCGCPMARRWRSATCARCSGRS